MPYETHKPLTTRHARTQKWHSNRYLHRPFDCAQDRLMHNKLLAYHSGKHTEVYTWRRGALSAIHVFNADAEGIAEFAAHLSEHAKLPIYFLVDIIEEDFRLETIPHILGRSRAALINRKLEQAFRNEPYRHTALQERDKEGRRDDHLLLSALTNSEALSPWINTILECKMALAGLYSVPLLSQEIIRKLGLDKAPHLLLVTRQSDGGLRQSYFQNGYLKLSRLVSLAGNDSTALIAAVNEESAKIQQHLNNQRLLPRDQQLEIHLLFHESECHLLLDGCNNTPTHQFFSLVLQHTAAALKLDAGAAADAKSLYLQFLARYSVGNQYAGTRESRYWRLKRVALAMKSSGIALVVFGILSAAVHISDGLNLSVQTDQILSQALRLEAEVQVMQNAFPSLPATPDILKGSVELAESLTAHPRTPETLMATIGRALDELPQVRLQRFKWILSSNPNQDIGAKSVAPTPPDAVPSEEGKKLELALLEGKIAPFTNYRNALAAVERLTAILNATPGLQATPLALPIETDPQAQLKGNLNEGAQPPAADFSLKLIYRGSGS